MPYPGIRPPCDRFLRTSCVLFMRHRNPSAASFIDPPWQDGILMASEGGLTRQVAAWQTGSANHAD